MNEISNKTLAILLIVAMAVTLFTSLYTLNIISAGKPLSTGRATTGTGEVNLTIESAKSIVLRGLTTIDFGSGYVNTSCTAHGTYANLTVDATGYTDQGDCWTSATANPPNQPTQPFRIENNGNQNVTLQIKCPEPSSFFSGYSGGNQYNISWKARANETSVSCPAASLDSTWGTCTGSYENVCTGTNFNYFTDQHASEYDEIAVDFNVVIPSGLTPNEYKNASITFLAS
jgi:hypothetical protein